VRKKSKNPTILRFLIEDGIKFFGVVL